MAGERHRVLVITADEEESRVVEVALTSLATQHFQVAHAASLSAGFREAASASVAAIILDVDLAQDSGRMALIRLLASTGDTPVVVLTPGDDPELSTLAVEAGAQDCIAKGAALPLVLPGAVLHAIERIRLLSALRRSEERTRLVLSQVPMLVWTTDPQLRVTSLTGLESLGLDLGRTVGLELGAVLGQSSPILGSHREALDGMVASFELEIQNKVFECRVEPLFDDRGGLLGCVGAGVDITERKDAERRLQANQRRYELIAESMSAGLWDWDFQSGTVLFSKLWKSQLGLAAEADLDRIGVWLSRVHPEDLTVLEAEIERLLHGQARTLRHEHRLQHEDGTWRWMQVRGAVAHDSEGRVARLVGSHVDITERREREERLAQSAFFDALTGVPNRSLLTDRLQHCFARRVRRRSYRFAVLFVDLDRFKEINDEYGHPVGDRLLVQAAERLRESLRPGDTVARVGGDEFVILVDDLRRVRDATSVADRVLKGLTGPFHVKRKELRIGASIGIAISSDRHRSPDQILRDADAAMYSAKDLGKGRYVIHDDAPRRASGSAD